jgi:hypothetical protein
LAGWQALKTGLWLLAILATAVAGFILCDAGMDLPAPVRAAAPWLVGAAGTLTLIRGLTCWWRLDESQAARRFEQHDLNLGSRLINAVQLARQPVSSPIGEHLRQEAIQLGQQAAAAIATWPAVQTEILCALAAAAFIALVWLGLAIGGAEMLGEITLRFHDPYGDHPPYSRMKFEVTPAATRVLYGGQVEIRARTHGAAAEKLWLVAETGTNTLRTLMFLAPDRSFFQTLGNLRAPTRYHVTDGRARSRRYPIEIRYTPQIGLVEVTTEFPAYTGKPARTARLAPEPQSLPAGTRVAFRLVSNRPLAAGTLELTPLLGGKAARIPLKPGPQENAVAGEFTLTEPVAFSLSVRDRDGLDSADRCQGRFNLLPDERPRILVLEPGRDAVATPSIRVPVRVAADDDYAVSRVIWLRSLNRSIERPLALPLKLISGPQSVEAEGAFDFASLGVKPGDVIDYYFEAADNYPQGPNVTLSKLYRIQIISQEQYEQVLRMAAARKALFEPYFKLDAWLQRLAERARNLEKQAQAGAEVQKDAAALADDLAKYQGELGQLLQQGILFDVEQSFRNTLVEQHNRAATALASLRQSLTAPQSRSRRLQETAEQLTLAARTERDEVEQPARQIAAVARLLARSDSFVKLARQQAELARLLRRFSSRTEGLSRMEQMELQELAYQQRRVQEGLNLLLASLPEQLSSLPDLPAYARLREDVSKFLQAAADSKIEDLLAECVRLLSALDGKSGSAQAQEAADRMDRLIARCSASGLLGDARQCLSFWPKLSESLGGTLEQILQAMGVNPDGKGGKGNGQSGQDGYSLFDNDVALYGPSMDLAGQQAGGQGDTGQSISRNPERVRGSAPEAGRPPGVTPGRVRPQPDARFPLRYRDVVGGYFKAIAESQTEGDQK